MVLLLLLVELDGEELLGLSNVFRILRIGHFRAVNGALLAICIYLQTIDLLLIPVIIVSSDLLGAVVEISKRLSKGLHCGDLIVLIGKNVQVGAAYIHLVAIVVHLVIIDIGFDIVIELCFYRVHLLFQAF